MTRCCSRTGLLVLLSFMVLGTGCHRGLPAGVLARQDINATEGGRVETSDGKLVMDIPPNALSGNTTVTIAEVDSPPSYPALGFMTTVGTCYDIDLGGVTAVDSISVTVRAGTLPSNAATAPAYYDSTYASWVFVGSATDSALGEVYWKTMHFSDWWLFGIRAPTITEKMLDVPYYYQNGLQWCFPTSMAMELKYLGHDREYHELAADLRLATDEGPNMIEELVSSRTLPLYQSLVGRRPCRWGFFGLGNDKAIRYILGNLIEAEAPSFVASGAGHHAVEFTGWSSDKAYFHDPSGAYEAGQIQAECDWSSFLGKITGLTDLVFVDAFDMEGVPQDRRRGDVPRLVEIGCGSNFML
jgi:hypothetical protein